MPLVLNIRLKLLFMVVLACLPALGLVLHTGLEAEDKALRQAETTSWLVMPGALSITSRPAFSMEGSAISPLSQSPGRAGSLRLAVPAERGTERALDEGRHRQHEGLAEVVRIPVHQHIADHHRAGAWPRG